MRTATLILACCLPALASAETIHKADGTTVVGGVIGEFDGAVLVLGYTGQVTKVPRAEIKRIAAEPPAPKGFARQLARARKAAFKKPWREAKKILKRYERAKSQPEQAAIAKELDQFGPRVLIKPLEGALKSSKPASQELALQRLSAMKLRAAVDPLIRAAITSKTKSLRPRAHAAAVAVDRDRTREVYKAIATAPTSAARRAAAIDFLGQMGGNGGKDVVPGLIYVLEKVEMEIQATLATAGSLRRVPVNLGTTGNAAGGATRVPIELPEMQMIKVATKISVPTLRALGDLAGKHLRSISGEAHKGSKAWKQWWNRQPEAAGKKLDD